MTPSTVCRRHRSLAGWQCTVCQKLLCPDCVGDKVVYPITVTSCVECGQLARQLTRRFRDTQPLAQRLAGAFTFPFTAEAAMFWAANAIAATMASYLPVEVILGVAGLITAAYFGVIRATSVGREMLEGAEYTDLFNSMVKPLLFFALATVLFWLPPVAMWMGDVTVTLRWVAVFGLLGMVWAPVALLGAATSTSPFILLNPVAILGLTLRLGRDAAIYVGSWVVLAVLMIPSAALAYALYSLPVLFVSRLLAFAVLLYPPLVGARISGLVLRLFGDVLGYGAPEDSSGPVLPDAKPRGVVPDDRNITEHLTEGEAPKRSFAPIELADETAEPQSEPSALPTPPEPRTRPMELDAAAMPSLAATLLEQVRLSIRDNDVGSAVEALKGLETFPSTELSGRELLWLGRAAASVDENGVAHDALLAAAESNGHEIDVAKAKVLLAKLLDERLDRKDDAAVWMERILLEHPESDPAVFARDWLKRRSAK